MRNLSNLSLLFLFLEEGERKISRVSNNTKINNRPSKKESGFPLLCPKIINFRPFIVFLSN